MAAPGRNLPYEQRVKIAVSSNPKLEYFSKNRDSIRFKITDLEKENSFLIKKVSKIKDNRTKRKMILKKKVSWTR